MTPLNFQEAADYAASRKVVLPEDYYGVLVGVQKSQAITVAGLTSLAQVQFVVDALQKTLSDGKTFEDFKAAVKANTIDITLPAYRLDNIFRTNIQSAYARGRWENHFRNADVRPYLMYDAVNDSRVRPNHLELDNFIASVKDAFWKTHYPPNGYRCRCTVISLSLKQALKRGLADQEKEAGDLPAPDDGWDCNVGADYTGPVKAAVPEKAEKVKKAVKKIAPMSNVDTQADEVVKEVSEKAVEVMKETMESAAAHNKIWELVGRKFEDAGVLEMKKAALINKYPGAANMSESALNFLYAYTTNSFESLNNYLRTGDPLTDPLLAGVLDVIRGFEKEAVTHMANTKKEFLRGARFSEDVIKQRYVKDAVLETRGMLSVSTKETIQDKFSTPHYAGEVGVKYTFKLKKSKAIRLEKYSKFDNEAESLVPPGKRFRVASSEYVKPQYGRPYYRVEMEEVEDDGTPPSNFFSREAQLMSNTPDDDDVRGGRWGSPPPQWSEAALRYYKSRRDADAPVPPEVPVQPPGETPPRRNEEG